MEKLIRQLFVCVGIILIFTILAISIYAINTVDSGFMVDNGITVEIDAWSQCKKVINDSENDYFVPTKSSAEWAAFQNNLPPQVSLSDCSPSCPDPSAPSRSWGSANSYFTCFGPNPPNDGCYRYQLCGASCGNGSPECSYVGEFRFVETRPPGDPACIGCR